MSKKFDKEELREIKGPDAFVATSERILDWIARNALLVFGAAGLVVVGVAAWLGMNYLNYLKEQKAVDAIYSAESELKKAETKVREDRAKAMQEALDPKKGKSAATPQAPVDFAKDYAPLVEPVKAAIQSHSSTRAAVVSALNLSYFLMQQKQFAAALEVLSLPSFRPGNSDVVSGFWHMHRGLTLIENQKPEDAIQVYKEVVAANELKAFHPEALLKLGVAYEAKGEPNLAKENYEKLTREFPNTEASTSAQQYLRLLDLKGQG